MALESGSGIWSLVVSNPAASDDVNAGDDHLRLIKDSLKQTFPNISATVNATNAQINHLSGVDSNIQNSIDTISASLQSEISRTNDLSQSFQAEITKVAYGTIYLSDSSAEFSATTSFTTFVSFDTVGVSKLITAGTATGALVVTNAGHYDIMGKLDVSSSAALVITALVMIDDATSNIRSEVALAAGGSGSLNLLGIETAGASSKIQIRLLGSITTAFTVSNAQLKVRRAD